MNQKATTRKSGVGDERDTKRTDSPVKDMKKKMAANAEKEKLTAEKPVEKSEKPAEKKPEKNGAVDKSEKKDLKQTEKKETDKKDNNASEKKDDSKGEKSAKPTDQPKPSPPKPKQNGAKAHNGNSDGIPDTNGSSSPYGTVSEDDSPAAEGADEQDELFPELAYDEGSDQELDPPARSVTRREQVKPTRTPETPRPASDKQDNLPCAQDDAKDNKSKEAKPKEDSTERKLRSADPKETKKAEKAPETPKKQEKETKKDAKKPENAAEAKQPENGEKEADKLDVEVVIEIDDDEPRKTDTNYSKSRVKVSPYRRSMRLADQTTSSVQANYTGNNTTMEMDITESSMVSESGSLEDSSYLSGLRSITGRRSYKPLKEMTLTRNVNRTARLVNVSGESTSRPTAPVVGRKRKPESECAAPPAADPCAEVRESPASGKRARLLDRLALPFRNMASTPLPIRRNPEIVGINTDLPLTAPVIAPEALKPRPEVATDAALEKDGKRCVVM